MKTINPLQVEEKKGKKKKKSRDWCKHWKRNFLWRNLEQI